MSLRPCSRRAASADLERAPLRARGHATASYHSTPATVLPGATRPASATRCRGRHVLVSGFVPGYAVPRVLAARR